jgi:hypothetical protein
MSSKKVNWKNKIKHVDPDDLDFVKKQKISKNKNKKVLKGKPNQNEQDN